MPHRNAPLTETGRLRLARCIVNDRWPLRRAAERFQVAPTTAARWATRYRLHGQAGMADRSSRPHHSPRRLPVRTKRRILGLRVRDRLGPARIAARLRLNPATVHRVLVRYGVPHLADLDRATGVTVRQPIRRYERARPASWSTSTSRSWAASPTVAGIASTAASKATATGRRPPANAATTGP